MTPDELKQRTWVILDCPQVQFYYESFTEKESFNCDKFKQKVMKWCLQTSKKLEPKFKLLNIQDDQSLQKKSRLSVIIPSDQ